MTYHVDERVLAAYYRAANRHNEREFSFRPLTSASCVDIDAGKVYATPAYSYEPMVLAEFKFDALGRVRLRLM
jgi:hypothetical protein